jgi:hypothetical protein
MDVESNISTPTQRRQPAGNTGEMSSNSELSSLQQEINTLREFIHAEDKRKKQPSWIRIFCSQLCERTMKGLRASTGLFGQCFSTASGRIMLNCIIVFVCGAVFYDLTLSPHSILRRGRSHEMADKYTLVYKGHIYRTLRPGVVLTCPVRFPVPDGWALVPEDDVPDVLINVVSKHYWGSAAMVLNKFAAYPTLSLIAQVTLILILILINIHINVISLASLAHLTPSHPIPPLTYFCTHRCLGPIRKQQTSPSRSRGWSTKTPSREWVPGST